jgi:glucosamine-6-phosphate deaminase
MRSETTSEGRTVPSVVERADAQREVAAEIAALVRARPAAVLGLATGGTMVGVYAELVRLHRARELDFARVTTFNLDEYVGLPAGDPRSFSAFMQEHLFAHVNLAPERTHLPDVRPPGGDIAAACVRYEAAIRAAGGIDLQLLGLGRNAHVAFNEPGAPADSRTRVVELAASTRQAAAEHCGGLERTPRSALTLGIATIREARRLRVLAFGAVKADAARAALQGPVGPDVPGSLLRGHADLRVWLDPAAARGL